MAENSTNLTNLPQEDFAAIENAVLETERGRWFLKEYAARNRHAETEKLLEAIARIESAMKDKTEEIKQENSTQSVDAMGEKIRFDLLDMMTAIANTKREIAAIGSEDDNNSHIGSATVELDAIVEATETATSKILETAEKIQEQAWNLREEGMSDDQCDNLDGMATDIYMACSFQDITGQRTQKVVQVLRYLENRLESMASIWANESVSTPDPKGDIDFKSEVDSRPDAHLLNGPQQEGLAIEQEDVDLMFVDIEDLDAAAEMEAMLEDSESGQDQQETAEEAPEMAMETNEAESGADDLLIIKEDISEESDQSQINGAEHPQIDSIQIDASQSEACESPAPEQAPVVAAELTESNQEALFSTHEV